MSLNINKYVDIASNYAIYGKNGYYIDPFTIKLMITDELNLSMSYDEIEKFIKDTDIIIEAEQIREFLEEKKNEEQPNLKKKLEEMKNNSEKLIFPCDDAESKIDASVEKMKTMSIASRYYFEPYSLEYFKTYVSILKEKCMKLFDIINDLEEIKSGNNSNHRLTWVQDLDFHVNEYGDIYAIDAIRLAETIIYNVKDMYDKITRGNNYETYLTFKLSKDDLLKDGILESEIYPRKEVQIKNLNYEYSKQFIALSEHQKAQLEEERIQNMLYWIEKSFTEDDKAFYPVLTKSFKKTDKNNENK